MSGDATHPPDLRLGHIVYSNCIPVHGPLLDAPDGIQVVEGEPARLNRMLAAGEIDVAPCSSIEYARHADRYSVLPDLSISADGAVRSILFESEAPPDALDGATVALPSASATSVALLRILLRRHWGVRCRFVAFDQASEDPVAGGADAALFIGDVALGRRREVGERRRTDLGQAWRDFTRLPFVFALWQARSIDEQRIERLHGRLLASRDAAAAGLAGLAARHAARYRMTPEALREYWESLRYDLDGDLVAGLTRFYELAAEEGEISGVPEIRWAGGGERVAG